GNIIFSTLFGRIVVQGFGRPAMYSRIGSGVKLLVRLSVWSVLVSSAFAQTGQGIIVGLVTDSTSAVVTGASVTARNPETGFTYTALTNEEGLYRILYVNPGAYEIAYEARGFNKVIRRNILVRSTETARVDLMLEVGGVVESVDVKAVSPLLESETSMVGHLVTGETINKLPAPQQNTQTVLFYMPGVTSQGGIGHVAGQRSRSFVATMDG